MNITLFQLNNLVRETIELTLSDSYWVEAELSECRESGGHCYLDLIEKDGNTNTPIARAQARCWRSTWAVIKPRFERTTGQSLHAGLKVLLKVKASFHEAYGFAWIVQDIDARFTMGDMARRRQEIINTLKSEGVFDLNRSLTIPMFAQRIAVISSATAAGYGDFCNQLAENAYGFAFKTRLFPAIMQGEQVEESVIDALNKINDCIDDFDVVVIIRGGGGTSDLSGFDTLALAENVANFPLPIITGIGHDRDESVLDMISCMRVKTPTAAADFLVNNLACTLDIITDAEKRIVNCVKMRMEQERLRIARIQSYLPVAFSLKKEREIARLDNITSRISLSIKQRILNEDSKLKLVASSLSTTYAHRLEREKHRLELLSHRVQAVDPAILLRRGYAIALHNGKAVKSATDVKTGDEIKIMLSDGTIETKVV